MEKKIGNSIFNDFLTWAWILPIRFLVGLGAYIKPKKITTWALGSLS